MAIVIAGFTPIPFFPIRFLVVMGDYPVLKYLFGVFVSRAPRFFILAWAGYAFNIPGFVLVALFILMIVFVNIPLVMSVLKKVKKINNQFSLDMTLAHHYIMKKQYTFY